MARYIDADELIKRLFVYSSIQNTDIINLKELKRLIEDSSTADVEEVKHGKWNYVDGFANECSVCHSYCNACLPLCPYCRAKMDLKDSDEELAEEVNELIGEGFCI